MNDRPIEQVLAMRYAKIVDTREFDEMNEIMTVDFVMIGAGMEFRSVGDFVASLTILKKYSATFHFVGNQLGVWDNDCYAGETYCVASHMYEKDGVERKMDMGIRYDDSIVKEGDLYKFNQRIFNLIWTQDLPITA
jgi:hypothetical protein